MLLLYQAQKKKSNLNKNHRMKDISRNSPSKKISVYLKLALWKATKANDRFLSLQSSEAHPTVMLFALIALEKFSQTSRFTLCNSSSHLPGVNKLRTSAFYTVTVERQLSDYRQPGNPA